MKKYSFLCVMFRSFLLELLNCKRLKKTDLYASLCILCFLLLASLSTQGAAVTKIVCFNLSMSFLHVAVFQTFKVVRNKKSKIFSHRYLIEFSETN